MNTNDKQLKKILILSSLEQILRSKPWCPVALATAPIPGVVWRTQIKLVNDIEIEMIFIEMVSKYDKMDKWFDKCKCCTWWDKSSWRLAGSSWVTTFASLSWIRHHVKLTPLIWRVLGKVPLEEFRKDTLSLAWGLAFVIMILGNSATFQWNTLLGQWRVVPVEDDHTSLPQFTKT